MSLKFRNSNVLSSKNVIFSKPTQEYEHSNFTKSTTALNTKQLALIEQLEIIEKQHEQIIAQAETDKQKILEDAKRASIDIEKNAYEEGYSQGLKNGFEDGYKEAYDKALSEAQVEIDSKIQEATEILLSSKDIISDYALSNKDEIINLAMTIAEKVLAKEIEKPESIDAIFEKALLEVKDKKSLVVKVNSNNRKTMEDIINSFKDELSLTDDIHIVTLSSIKDGDVVIETENGIITTGINVALENIKSELL